MSVAEKKSHSNNEKIHRTPATLPERECHPHVHLKRGPYPTEIASPHLTAPTPLLRSSSKKNFDKISWKKGEASIQTQPGEVDQNPDSDSCVKDERGRGGRRRRRE
jgi:hypothetical protein